MRYSPGSNGLVDTQAALLFTGWWKGKERKRNERKRKERKGTERKGKERNGMERKGQERKGKTSLHCWASSQSPCTQKQLGFLNATTAVICVIYALADAMTDKRYVHHKEQDSEFQM